MTLGCCTDHACTPNTCMRLPTGVTCGDCAHWARCNGLYDCKLTDTTCDWFPRQFRKRAVEAWPVEGARLPNEPFGVHVPDPCCTECSCGTGRRALVQAVRDYRGKVVKVAGTIAWWEHERAWLAYRAQHWGHQSADETAQRGGFEWYELVDLLGREPETWEER